MDDTDLVPEIDVSGRASEDKLGDLHGVVAEYLTLAVKSGRASPAIVGAAITFLKNNAITASPSQNAALSRLSQTLQERKNKKGGLTIQGAKEAEAAFSDLMGTQIPGWAQ